MRLPLLAGGALWLGFRPWLRILHRPAAVWVAAGLHGSLWITLFYANSAMPNHHTAMGAAAAVGCFLAPRPRYAGVAAGLAVVTLIRPNDGVAVAVPLLLAAVLMPALRGHGRLWGRLSAVAAGLVAGALPWVVEAEVRFGGVHSRLAEADEVQGGLRAVFSLGAHFTALDGPLLCRPCTDDSVRLPATEWWGLLPLLVGLGLWAERRARRSTAPLWPAVAPYLFLVPYAAPRFLLPAYALLALPAAVGLLAVVHRARTRRSLPTAVLALALLGHWSIQAGLVHHHAGTHQRARGDWVRTASVLREHGVHPPCVLAGNTSTIPIAHTAGALSRRRISRRTPVRWSFASKSHRTGHATGHVSRCRTSTTPDGPSYVHDGRAAGPAGRCGPRGPLRRRLHPRCLHVGTRVVQRPAHAPHHVRHRSPAGVRDEDQPLQRGSGTRTPSPPTSRFARRRGRRPDGSSWASPPTQRGCDAMASRPAARRRHRSGKHARGCCSTVSTASRAVGNEGPVR